KLDLADDLLFQHRFRQEARAAAEVHEPHLVPIIEASEADGRHYLAVDYVTGGSLTAKIADSGTFAGDDVVRVVSEVAAGLDALSSRSRRPIRAPTGRSSAPASRRRCSPRWRSRPSSARRAPARTPTCFGPLSTRGDPHERKACRDGGTVCRARDPARNRARD